MHSFAASLFFPMSLGAAAQAVAPDASDEDVAVDGVVSAAAESAGDGGDEGGFPRPARAHHREHLARASDERDAAEDREHARVRVRGLDVHRDGAPRGGSHQGGRGGRTQTESARAST